MLRVRVAAQPHAPGVVSRRGSNVPGPGNYETNNRDIYSHKNGKIGRDKRDVFAGSMTPGPGMYENKSTNLKHRDPSWSYARSSREYASA